MKKIIVILLVLLSTSLAKAQIPDIESQIALCKKEVKGINDLRLKRTVYTNGEFVSTMPEEFFEWANILYLDTENRIRKTITHFEFPEERGLYYRYFNNEGVAILSLYGAYSGMNNGYSVVRYLNNEGDFLFVDYIRIDDDSYGQLIEHIIRYGGYEVGDEGFDLVYKVDDLSKFVDLQNLQNFNHFVTTQFVVPKAKDTTFINTNNVNLRNDPSTTYNPIHKLNVRDEVTILEVEGKWYKVEFHNRYGDNKIGYVLGDFLEPVEKEIK